MNDYIIRVTAGNGAIRGFFATTKNIANDSFKYHNTTQVASAAMGRCLTAASMMGLMLKNDSDLITLKINGDGPMKGLVVTANSSGDVKGYPYNNDVPTYLTIENNIDVGGALGYGTMTIIKDTGLKEPYSGQVPLITGEIGDDLTYYFAKSEQTPTSIGLSTVIDTDYSVKASGGFIIQLMPGAQDETIDVLEKKINDLEPLSKLLSEGNTPEDICEKLLGIFSYEILDKKEVSYKCNCSYEKTEKALYSIGKEELNTILKEDKQADVKCHFCNKNYHFTENDLVNILNNL